ncbi:MAG: peptidylprolyl isomerase [Clostridiales bacterium]|nr:peptidylprolyl isomerase [Clostridiales bacterium]
MEDGKKINAEIYPDLAPITVENFIKLVEEHFYDGLIFHRVIPGFMIQGGGFDAALNQKESESIKGEFSSNGVENPLPHTRGVLSMARTNEPDSASSQFFIMHEDGNFLDGEYAAFGKVTDEESLAVVDEIANVKTTTVSSKQMENVPVKTVAIKTITLND